MKKIIMLGLLFTTKLYSTPEAPKDEGSHDSASSRTDVTQEAKAKADAESSAENTQSKPLPKAPDVPTTSPTSMPVKPSMSEQGVNLNGDTIATVTHPDQNSLFSSTQATSKIIDNGDGTHAITTETTKKGWFTTKKSSITTKINSSGLTTDQILTKVQKASKNLNAKNIHEQLRNSLNNKKATISSNPADSSNPAEAQKIAYNALKKNGITHETTQFDDGTQEIKINNINGTSRSIKTNIDGSVISDTTFDQGGEPIDNSNFINDSALKTLQNRTQFNTSRTIQGKGSGVIGHFYDKQGRIIKNVYTQTGETETITYQTDGTSIGTKRDDNGNITQQTLFDTSGNPVKAQIPSVTAEGKSTVSSITYNKAGVPSSLTSYY